MRTMKNFLARFTAIGLILAVTLISFPLSAWAQDYPNKPITLYCSYVAGATTDITARALAAGAEKLLGVPVMVENKPGGNSTVCASLLATKKPDGYTLAVMASGVVDQMPLVYKVSYDPFDSFTPLIQYSRWIGGVCVLSESPIKTIEEFIKYSKAHPGMTYGSPGMYSQQHLAVHLLGECKGLPIKHIPYKGGSEAITAFLGKHTDFIAGSGSHIPYVRQGAFRLLLVYNATKRDPNYPDIPILSELGCEDYPADGIMAAGPKGLPQPIVKKLKETFKKVADSPEFQKMLVQINMPYDYKDGTELEKEARVKHEWFKAFYKKIGVIK
jgi:tripartite-type tricarboxylate transporter receptor subunit TctC